MAKIKITIIARHFIPAVCGRRIVAFAHSHVMSNHINVIAYVTMEQLAPIQSRKSVEEPPKIGKN